MWVCLLQIRQQNFRMQPRIREYHRLQIVLQKFLGHPRTLVDVTAPNSQRAIHRRWVIKHERLFARRRPIRIQHLDCIFNQPFRQLARIRDRRRTANKLRRTPIKSRNPPQPSQHVAQMAAKYSAVGVQLINHDVFQIFKQPRPPRVVRQYPGVQHVRIGQDNVSLLPDRLPRIARRVPVVGKHRK